MRRATIAVFPGDGIGEEVVACAIKVLRALKDVGHGLTFEFATYRIGAGAYRESGQALSAEAIEGALAADGVLHGATDFAAIPSGVVSPLRRLKRAMGTYAIVRPARTYPRGSAQVRPVDVIVVRENTEGMGSGIEYMIGADTACLVRVVTRNATERIARRAFQIARSRRRQVTATRKNLKLSDGLWIKTMEDVAAEFPDVEFRTMNIDAAALELVRDPSQFDVLVCENQHGDILSDVAAGVTVGSIGLSPSATYGDAHAIFEPVHGSAPDIAGLGRANPGGAILAASMMLHHLGEGEAGSSVHRAVEQVICEGKHVTPDIGGSASTIAMTNAVIEALAMV